LIQYEYWCNWNRTLRITELHEREFDWQEMESKIDQFIYSGYQECWDHNSSSLKSWMMWYMKGDT
jgi:hypothetical protein